MKQPWLWVALACALFLAEELPLFQHRWVEDESWQSIPAYALLTERRIRNPTFAETDAEYEACVKPPAHTFVLLPMFKWFGVGVWQARLPSLAAGLGVVVLTFLLSREMAGQAAGVASAWLVATDNTLFLAGRTARPEIFVAFCALVAAILAARSLNASGLRLALGSGLAVGGAMMFHPSGAATAAATGGLIAAQSGIRCLRDKRLWTCVGAALMVGVAFLAWSHSTPAHSEAFAMTYSRGEKLSLLEKLRGEVGRYADYLGVGNLRLNVGVPIPVRAHIVAAIGAAFVIVGWKNRKLCAALLLLTIPYLLWWAYLLNKTSRYFAVVAPFFAIALATAACMLAADPKWRTAALTVCVVVFLSQIAGNVILLSKSRAADFTAVQGQLRQLIPAEASVYGAITFWPALHDRPYYSYERMPFDYAVQKRRPQYLILNDRVMVKGMGWGLDDWAKLRKEANAFARQHGRLAGRVSNSFYGDLEIYRLDYKL